MSKNKVLITINQKGGAGKSTVSTQFLTAYVLDRNKGNPVKLYEFDAHNSSSKNVEKDINIESKIIRDDVKSIQNGIAAMEFASDEGDIIVDVGGSHNTDLFLSHIAKSSMNENIIFVVPELNQVPESSESTIAKIMEKIRNPKIILALNNYNQEGGKKKEDEYLFLYGSKEHGIEPWSEILDLNIPIVTIPRCELSLGIAGFDKTSLWALSRMAESFSSFSTREKREAWGQDGELCDEETYLKKSRILNSSMEARDTLEYAKGLFDAIDELRK